MKQYYPDIMESFHVSTLDNGLKVYIVTKKDTKTHTAHLAIPFGSIDLQQQIDDTFVSYPAGTAHFLEHKLFENHKGKDVMQLFTKMGAQVNAFTSHYETVYYFRTSRKSFQKELNLLLDFVQSFSISEAAVEKEKGIIAQELKMYQQIPEQRLVLETYRSLYHTHPIREDIGGDEDSIQTITKDLLDYCYSVNYHPSRSVLVLVSSKKAEDILAWIELNQSSKTFKPAPNVKSIFTEEPKQTQRDNHTFNMDIQNTKMTLSYKLPLASEDNHINVKHEWSLRFLLDFKFSPINTAYQTWIESNRIHDYFGYDVDVSSHIAFLIFFIESEDENDFRSLIQETLIESIDEYADSIDLLKRRYTAQIIRSFDDHDDYALTLIRSDFQQLELDALVNIIQSIQMDDLKAMQAILCQLSPVLVRMQSKKQNTAD